MFESAFIRQLKKMSVSAISPERRANYIFNEAHADCPDTSAIIGGALMLARNNKVSDVAVRNTLRSIYTAAEARFRRSRMRDTALLDLRRIGDEFDRIASGATARRDVVVMLERLNAETKRLVRSRLDDAKQHLLSHHYDKKRGSRRES